MNSIRRAITAERKRILKLSPISIVQEQHASFSTTTTRSTKRTFKSPKTKAPELRAQPPLASATSPPTTSSSSNDSVSKEPVTWPKPSEIPWQAKVVNSVNLIGRVKIPVQFVASSDGSKWAGTIISQDDGSQSSSSLPSFWIPVIFEGDLASTAMCHLKEKDYVHVAGHLSVDLPPFKLTEAQANVQVMAHSINFVQGSQSNKISTPAENKWSTKNSELKEETYIQLFDDVESSPVYKPKEVARLYSDPKADKPLPNTLSLWSDLLTNFQQWTDNRENKHKGLVKPNYPDFKRKDTGVGLWLDRAPPEILQGLARLNVSGLPTHPQAQVQKAYAGRFGSKQSKKHQDAEFWKHLVENPNEWWDNRLNKKNSKGPDFKNKESGKGLWLNNAPAWAISGFPPLKPKSDNVDTKKAWAS